MKHDAKILALKVLGCEEITSKKMDLYFRCLRTNARSVKTNAPHQPLVESSEFISVLQSRDFNDVRESAGRVLGQH